MRKFTILFLLFFILGISIFCQQPNYVSTTIKSDYKTGESSASNLVTDIDGNTYKTVVIGYQTWMTENLRTTKFTDGSPIPKVTDDSTWINLTTPAYCWYNNDIKLKPVYGALYNSFTISKDLCPTGWKVPSDADWEELADYLQGKQVAGGKMKEKGTKHWQDPNEGATNSSGFTARPGGGRSFYNGEFHSLGSSGEWWANTIHNEVPEYTLSRILYNIDDNLTLGAALHSNGLSVRCLKERADTIPLINLKRGLIGYYPFNGNTNDESGNGHHGTDNGVTLTSDRFGNPNSAYAFTGKYNTLSFSGVQLPGPASTITSWIKPTDESIDTILNIITPQTFKMLLRVVNKHYQLELTIGDNKIIMFDTNGKTNIDPARPRYDFVGIRYNEEVIQFVVNHLLVSEYWIPANDLNFKFPLTVKKNPVYTFKGIFDDLRIYNRSLSDKEFSTLGNDRPIVPPVITADSVNNIGRDVASIYSTINYKNDGSEILETGVYYSTSPDPDSSDHKIINCCTADEIVIHLTGLAPNTTYYAKIYAIDTIGIGYSNEVNFTTSPALNYGSVTDVDGNKYKTIKIGTQTWMAENLKTTKYADGTPLENGTMLDYAQGKYYFIYENDSNYKDTYGLLYTWLAATNGEHGDTYPEGIQGVCPVGWHIPNIAEKTTLLDYLGGSEIASGKLRETGYIHWDDSNTGTSNESGFSALGAGVRFPEDNGIGYYNFLKSFTIYWSSQTIPSNVDILAQVMNLNTGSAEIGTNSVHAGASVRCIKNENSIGLQGLGDIDGNNRVQDIDAALALQYSVGLNPLPEIDPLPWEDSRVHVADVDLQNGISAYDASLILQRYTGLINDFPGETNKKSSFVPQADLDVSLEGGYIVFRPIGELYGLNITINGISDELGAPQFLNSTILTAVKISSGKYSVGFASSISPSENDIIMKIPIRRIPNRQVNVNLKINNNTREFVLGSPTTIEETIQQPVEIYPNPAKNILYIGNLPENTPVSINSLQGKMLIQTQIINGMVDISSLGAGVYFIHFKDGKNIIIRKIVKQ